MNFYVYQSKKDRSIYAAVGEKKEPCLAELPDHSWSFSKEIPDDGKDRIGFDPKEVREGIAAKGYYIWRVKVEIKEMFSFVS